MRILYFDTFSGVSGDMTVAALVALGLDFTRLEAELRRLPLHGYRLRLSDRRVNGIHARTFNVDLDDGRAPHRHEHEHTHGSAHAHRSFAEIRSLIQSSTLASAVKERALAIFSRLADAEARVHAVPLDEVTFHEVGAIDSIVDIVGTAVGVTELGIERAFTAALPLGSGMVRTQHGPLPIPAPATAELLKAYPVRLGDGEGELVTPTGAAIIAALTQPGAPLPPIRIEAVGYGAGARTLRDRPNVLRLVLGTTAEVCAADEMIVLETNVDDASPELLAHVMERLFAAGARDVWFTPVQMKKNRPGTLLQVLAEPALRDALAAVVLTETTAIGVRHHPVGRLLLPREQVTVETDLGSVAVKVARAPDGSLNIAPEYESCKRLAAERTVPLKVVYQAAIAAARQRLRS